MFEQKYDYIYHFTRLKLIDENHKKGIDINFYNVTINEIIVTFLRFFRFACFTKNAFSIRFKISINKIF